MTFKISLIGAGSGAFSLRLSAISASLAVSRGVRSALWTSIRNGWKGRSICAAVWQMKWVSLHF